MNIQRRTSRKGEISYLFRVSLGYDANGQRIVRSMTWKPEKGMSPKKVEREVNRQAVLFEERANAEYIEELTCKTEQREQEEDDLEYEKSHTTFKELAKEWLALQEIGGDLKNSSYVRMKGCQKRTYDAIGDVLVTKLSYRKIQSFITSLGKKKADESAETENTENESPKQGLSRKTQKHYGTFISDVMRYAIKCKLIDENPCEKIVYGKDDHKEKVIYTLDEVKRMLAVIDQKAPTNYKLYYHLLAYCGMRRGEALGIEYKDIDVENSLLILRRTSNYHVGFGVYTDTLKNDPSYRTLYLQPKLIDMVKQLKAEQKIQAKKCGDQWHESDRLFVNWCGRPANPNYQYAWLKKFCKKENLPFHGLHSFRHFVATQALANGVDVKSVSAMLGHSQTSTTLNIYTHAVQPANEKALNKVADLLGTP